MSETDRNRPNAIGCFRNAHDGIASSWRRVGQRDELQLACIVGIGGEVES